MTKQGESTLNTLLTYPKDGSPSQNRTGNTTVQISLINESSESVAALPPKSADLIIAHPPWGVNTFAQDSSVGGFGKHSEFCTIMQGVPNVLHPEGLLIVGVPEIIRRSNTLFFCPKAVEETLAGLGFNLHHVDFWLKKSPEGLHAGQRWIDSKCDETVAHSILEWLMVFQTQQPRASNAGQIISMPIERDPVHPAVWPYELACELVSLYSKPGAHVVDLYMGRGTVGRACASLGRRFTGFEICTEFFSRAQAYVQSPACVSNSAGKNIAP